jgi:site-specific DNA-methyltransferase (adenine-specific)
MKGPNWNSVGNGKLFCGDIIEGLEQLDEESCQLIIADPPYFQVLLDAEWDNSWESEGAYIDWTLKWVKACHRVLKADGLFYIFGQLGKREHAWIHLCSEVTKVMQFHDMIIWDRAVGYNERYDSFTPQYEMVLALRKDEKVKPYFNKDAVRIPYDEATIQTYLKDNRYKDKEAREKHLRKGKYATNILRVPSLKGQSKEKIGHPSQKPLALIEKLIFSGSREGDIVLDPFIGSGTTAAVCEAGSRPWIGIDNEREYIDMTTSRIENVEPTLFNKLYKKKK